MRVREIPVGEGGAGSVVHFYRSVVLTFKATDRFTDITTLTQKNLIKILTFLNKSTSLTKHTHHHKTANPARLGMRLVVAMV